MSADRPTVTRLQHISLPFPGDDRSVATAREFYTEIMGLEERPVPPALPGVVLWWAVGEQELHLFGEPSGVAVNDQSHRHPCFQVDDAVRFRAYLDAAGVPTQDHNGDIPGRPRFFATDPFGNTLEFVQFEADHW